MEGRVRMDIYDQLIFMAEYSVLESAHDFDGYPVHWAPASFLTTLLPFPVFSPLHPPSL